MLSPFAVCWVLLTRQHKRWLPTIACYAFGPLAVCWMLLVRRVLVIQMGTLTYEIKPAPSRAVHFGGSLSAYQPPSRWKLGPIEVSASRRDSYVSRGSQRVVTAPVRIRLFALCPEDMIAYEF